MGKTINWVLFQLAAAALNEKEFVRNRHRNVAELNGLMGYPSLLMGYRPLLMGYPPLLMGYRTLLMGYPPLLMGYPPLYRGSQFYWWRKPEFSEKTT
jgi:hypothetical protein